MLYVVEKLEREHDLYIDQEILKDLILRNHEMYEEMEFKALLFLKEENPRYRRALPLGTIEFVNTYLKKFYCIPVIYPIEVPNVLRNDYFLKREYRIVDTANVPREGRWFVKDVSRLKSMTYIGDMYDNDQILNNFTTYQVSEIINILAEYRVYVVDGKIYAINYYNGDPCILPDMDLITRANMLWSTQPDYPKSYTMDVAVTPRGTCILECHVTFACGLYTTMLGTNFLQSYHDGLRYLKKYNREILPDAPYRVQI